MKYKLTETIEYTFDRQQIVLPKGKILELTPEQAARFGTKIVLADDRTTAPPAVTDWKPTFRAWLENDQLRTTGTTDDLASEIVKLTSDNLPLQKELLLKHVGAFSNPCWTSTARKFVSRAKELFDGGMGLHEANYQAAEEMHLLAFSNELGIVFYEPATNNPDPF